MKYSTIEFAKYVLMRVTPSDQESPNHVQLQKWMYIIYGVSLVIQKAQLFDEQPENWPLGPVFPKLYRHIKKVGIESLKEEQSLIIPTSLEEKITNAVLNTFGSWSAEELTNWTHRDHTAWAKTLEKNGEFNTTMNNQNIEEEFTPIVNT